MSGRMALLALALMLAFCAQAQGACVVHAADVTALVSSEGETLIQDDAIDALFMLAGTGLFAAGRTGDYGLYNARGERLNDQSYEMLSAVGDMLLFRQGGCFGAADLSGNTVVEPEWDQLTYAGKGAFLALKGDLYDDQPDELICVIEGEAPKPAGTRTVNGLKPFCDGRMAFMLSDGQYGYVDARGRQVIPPEWRYAGDFSEGVAMVSDGDGTGLIDTQGRIVVDTEYRWMQRGDGIIAAMNGDRLDVYDSSGMELLYSIEEPGTDAELCAPYLILRDRQSARVYDTEGVCRLEALRETIFEPGLDGQLIASDGAWGEMSQYILNPDGSRASKGYQRLLPLCGGRYAWQSFQDVQYEGRGPAGTQTAWDYEGLRCGLLDADGRELLPAEYAEIMPAGDDRLVLVTENRVILADLDGNALREWPITQTSAPSSEEGV